MSSDGLNTKTYRDWNFWKGLIIPTILPATVFILLLLSEFLSWDWSVGISLLLGWPCTLCAWPIIGFSLASNIKIEENMRKGAKVSGNI
ncbi:MAG: hypothetical protein VYA86_05230, partial [Candidatus Thermoplasmatota archaeon]|nr:hypothetical protein [Candidatus Thermoplasmatota archaeon]